MILNTFKPKNTGDKLQFLLTENTDFHIKQTQTKPQETTEFKMNKTTKTFSFDTPLNLENQGMLGLTRLEVYSCDFNFFKENNKIVFHKQEKLLVSCAKNFFLLKMNKTFVLIGRMFKC